LILTPFTSALFSVKPAGSRSVWAAAAGGPAFLFAIRLGRARREQNGQRDPAAQMDLLQLSAVERRIAELLGSPVDPLPEPVEKRRLQDQINRDRRRAF